MKKFKVRYTKYACCIGFVNLDYTNVCVAYLLFSGVFNNYPSWLFLRKIRFHVIFETIKKIATSKKLRIKDIQSMMYWFFKVRVYFYFQEPSTIIQVLFVCLYSYIKKRLHVIFKTITKIATSMKLRIKDIQSRKYKFCQVRIYHCVLPMRESTEDWTSFKHWTSKFL